MSRGLRRLLKRFAGRFKGHERAAEEGCRHKAVPDYSRWENTPSGNGFWISKCRHCGTEMTKPNAGRWEPVALKDRH